jgi:opacity protein-like surface antigen
MKFITVAAVLAGAALSSAAMAQTDQPQANPNAPANSALKSPHQMKEGAPAAGHNSFTRSQAKGRIEKAGFTEVTRLTKTRQGLWTGRAMQDGHRVTVVMDYQGNVTTQ